MITGQMALPGIALAGGRDVRVESVPDLTAIENAFTQLAQSVSPVAVAIEVRVHQDVAAPKGIVVEAVTNGSGFIIRPDGYIVTNHHVIQYADEINVVRHDGTSYPAEIVQFDHRSDLAVLRIPASGLPVARLGDIRQVKPGQWAFTVGNPFGVAARDGRTSFSAGVIGGLGRFVRPPAPTEQGERFYGDLIQTDASLNPGSSGGPLFDIRGEVIGVGTVTISLSGAHEELGFAIPINDRTRRIIELLSRGEPVRYGQLGIEVVEVDDAAKPGSASSAGGVRIAAVRGGGSRNPAARAGLRSDDIIIEMNGRRLRGLHDYRIRLDSLLVDDDVAIRYQRRGKVFETHARLVGAMEMEEDLARLSEPKATLRIMSWKGLKLAEPTEGMAGKQGIRKSDLGLYVLGTTCDGPFSKATDVVHDYVVRCNGTPVRTVEELAMLGEQEQDTLEIELLSGRVLELPR